MGPIPVSGSFPQRLQHATLTPEQVRGVADLSRIATWKTVGRCNDLDMASEIHRITLEERDRGWLKGPYKWADLARGAVLTRRFGVKQSTTMADGTRTFRTRPIDDYSESLVNATNSSGETIQPMSIDVILASLSTRTSRYLDMPWSTHLSVCTLLRTKKFRRSRARSYPLGLGLPSWVVSHALWLTGVKIFKFHWAVFFDDFYLIASKPESRHVELAQQLFFRLVGWEVSSEKEANFDTIARILGVQVDLSESSLGTYSVCNVETRVRDLVSSVNSLLEKGRMTMAEMRVLRGRLIFTEAQIYGRITGIHMQKLAKWEHAIGDVAIDEETKSSLEFLRDRVLLGGPRCVVANHGRVFHLYTDASYENGKGGLGGVLLDGSGNLLSSFSSQINEKHVAILNPFSKKTIIFELKALAVFIGCNELLPALGLHQSDRLVVFVDNEAVLCRLISGNGGGPIDNCTIHNVLTWEYNANLLAWYERVTSPANVADAPSRGDVSGLCPKLAIDVDVSSILQTLLGCPSD